MRTKKQIGGPPVEPAPEGGFAVLTDHLLKEEPDPILPLRDVQEELKVSRITLFRWIKAGKLVATKVGSQWRVRRSAVEAMKDGLT